MADATAYLGDFYRAKNEVDSIGSVHNIKPDIIQTLKLSIDVLQADEGRFNDIALNIISPTNDGSSVLNKVRKVSSYTLSSTNHDLLHKVSLMTEPEAAYARALLSYLTGEMVDPNVPMPVSNRSVKSRVNNPMDNEICYLNPNPAESIVKLGIKLFEIGANYRYEMINLMGVTVSVGKIENEISVDVSSIANGVYMVKIMKDDKPIDFKKLVIQK